MRLSLPDGQLTVSVGVFTFEWTSFGDMTVHVDRCTSVSIRTPGQDSGAQIIFHFQPGAHGAGGRVMVRLDVPPPCMSEASRFVAELQQTYGLQDSASGAPEDESLHRVPCDSEEWLAVPVSDASAELYTEIFDRIAAVPAP